MSSDCWKHQFASMAAEAVHHYAHAKIAYAEVEERRSITPQEWATMASATALMAIAEQIIAQNAVLFAGEPEESADLLEMLQCFENRHAT